jgi:Pao retrotransposon peptidase
MADPHYYKPAPIDIILGADIYHMIVKGGIQKGSPTAINSELGWILTGPIQPTNNKSAVAMVSLKELSAQVERFWDLEEMTIQESKNENEVCEQHYADNVKRLPSGRYQVKIPFKEERIELGDSKNTAMARFLQIERKMSRDKHLKEEYHKFMQEYLDLGHMIPSHHMEENSFYLPHHAVVKESSNTTKVRVVFDASAKTTMGISLNDQMMVGPVIQDKLSTILLRWRTHKYVFTSDVEKMYQQIQIASEHQKYQKILWRFNSHQPIQEFKLTTVTYGTAAAPYLAVRTLHQLASDEAETFPLASKVLKQDFYVDDLMSGSNSKETARKIIKEIINMFQAGKMVIRKWTSNHPDILKMVPSNLKLDAIIELNKEETVKTLGVLWSPITDRFSFKVQIEPQAKQTKRNLTSKMARIFDPLGWLAPVTISTKLFTQSLWQEKFGWDDILPENITNQWTSIEKELPMLGKIEIPRYIEGETEDLELHGFCDASERAYAAVVYSRAITQHGIKVTMLTAKTRVSPLKNRQTLPRLELLGAVLLSRLMKEVQTTLNFKNENKIHYWSDSTITLAWIKGNNWKQFVANRVNEIQSNTNINNWHHVSTKENPADCASRGIRPSALKDFSLWWQGPSWLSEVETKWTGDMNFTTQQ